MQFNMEPQPVGPVDLTPSQDEADAKAFDTTEGEEPSLEEDDGVFAALPDELMLQIFQHLDNLDIVSSVANVSLKWRRLSVDPVLWKNRLLFYNASQPEKFIKVIQSIRNEIKYLHVGGHQTLEEQVLKAILTSEMTQVKCLNFLCSCRADPAKVLDILAKFGSHVEFFALCLNDEIVSYGQDGKTCYAISHCEMRPGILISLIGKMTNLRHLKLYGGFDTKWYFGELLEAHGCNKIETLDLKDFGEFFERIRPYHRMNFVESLIRKNKSHLKCIKLSVTCAANNDIKRSILECHKTLEELLIDTSQIKGLLDGLEYLKSLHLSGRYLNEREKRLEAANYIKSSSVVHNLIEITLIQFSYFPDMIFHEISKSCQNIKVFRMEGLAIGASEIITVLNNLPSLKKLCIRDTDLVEERHLVSLELHLCPSTTLNFDEVFSLDCSKSTSDIMKGQCYKLKIFETGCQCKSSLSDTEIRDIKLHLDRVSPSSLVVSHQNSSPRILAKSQTSTTASFPQNGTHIVLLLLSNRLKEEYLFKFNEFDDNDLTFHFDQ